MPVKSLASPPRGLKYPDKDDPVEDLVRRLCKVLSLHFHDFSSSDFYVMLHELPLSRRGSVAGCCAVDFRLCCEVR